MDNENVTLTFDTQDNRIGARALADNLTALTNAFERANLEGKPDGSVLVSVTAVREGSFQAVIEVAKDAAVVALAIGVDNVANIIKYVMSYLEIKKRIGDAKIVESEENPDGTTNIIVQGGAQFKDCSHITVNMLQNPDVNKPYAKAMGSLNAEGDIRGFSISDSSSTELVRVEAEEFSRFQQSKTIDNPHPDERKTVKNAILFIRKIDFASKTRKWGFAYNDSPVTMTIGDKRFWAEVLEGRQKFANGDKIEADLDLLRRYDSASGQYMNKSYTITNVIKHIPRIV